MKMWILPTEEGKTVFILRGDDRGEKTRGNEAKGDEVWALGLGD